MKLGAGTEISIKELLEMIVRLKKFDGRIEWDTSKPDGQPRGMLENSRAKQGLGLRERTSVEEGVGSTWDL